MPSAAITLIRSRIGDMGLPGVVWPVYGPGGEIAAFYDRTKAERWVAANAGWLLGQLPISVKDAFDRG